MLAGDSYLGRFRRECAHVRCWSARAIVAQPEHEVTHRRYDCEDRVRSLMVMGCGLVTAGVTRGMTGFRALVRLVRSWSPAPARLEELA